MKKTYLLLCSCFSAIGISAQSLAPSISFSDNPVNHNMHIASDGNFYYTINGGTASSGQISKFSLTGSLIQTYPIQIDGRGLSYNSADGFFYSSTYGGDVVKIDDMTTGTFSVFHATTMQDPQASFAISTDGTKYYDFFSGKCRIHDFTTGNVIDSIMGLSFGSGNFGGEMAVAVDANDIYTCNATTRTVYAYDMSGNLLQTLTLDSGDCGIALSYMNGMLFISKDGNYGVGRWYGYGYNPTAISNPVEASTLSIFPNPSNGVIRINGGAINSVEIFSMTGAKVYSEARSTPCDVLEIDLSDLTPGTYFIRSQEGSSQFIDRIVLE